MQKAVQHSVARRVDLADESRDSGASAASAIPLPSGKEIVTVCAWCPELHILAVDRNPGDLLFVVLAGRNVNIFRSRAGEVGITAATLLTISAGICRECREKYFPASGAGSSDPRREASP